MKRKMILLLLTFFFCTTAYSQLLTQYAAFCANIDNVWSSWKTYSGCYIYGDYCKQLSMTDYKHHPSEFVWRITFDGNPWFPAKSKEWREYSGTIEFYISDKVPDAKSALLISGGFPVAPWNHNTEKGQMPCVKVTKKAKIKVAPYRKHPKIYNIWFDNMAFGLEIKNNM